MRAQPGRVRFWRASRGGDYTTPHHGAALQLAPLQLSRRGGDVRRGAGSRLARTSPPLPQHTSLPPSHSSQRPRPTPRGADCVRKNHLHLRISRDANFRELETSIRFPMAQAPRSKVLLSLSLVACRVTTYIQVDTRCFSAESVHYKREIEVAFSRVPLGRAISVDARNRVVAVHM